MVENPRRDNRHEAWPATSLFLWPFIALASASEVAAVQAGEFARLMLAAEGCPAPCRAPDWTTPNRVRLELPTMDLRDFSPGRDGTPTLVCAPFTLHGATISDFAPGHSLVEALARDGCPHVFVTDWRSASRDMRLLTLDDYLAALNVAIDEIGPPVDLVGLCQGGVMALILAARFPAKVRRLVLAGAPVDTGAAASLLSTAAQNLPLGVFDEVVRLGEGRVLGQRVLDLLGPALQAGDGAAALQLEAGDAAANEAMLQRFRDWYACTLDLPGPYYRDIVAWLFKENRLAEGRFVALGRQLDLGDVRQPLFLLAARDDEVVARDQLLATQRLVGTRAAEIESLVVPGGHLGLFVGRRTLREAWTHVARWLAQPSNT